MKGVKATELVAHGRLMVIALKLRRIDIADRRLVSSQASIKKQKIDSVVKGRQLLMSKYVLTRMPLSARATIATLYSIGRWALNPIQCNRIR